MHSINLDIGLTHNMTSRKFINDYPDHPLVVDVAEKAGLFDEAAVNFEVPPLPQVAA